MQKNTAIDLMDFLQSEGFDAELYEDYSGRGMYGRTTTGITTNASFGEMESMEEEMELAGIDPSFSKDSMGLDYIYY